MQARVFNRDVDHLERELERRVEGRLRLVIRTAVADEVRWVMNGSNETTQGLTRRQIQILQALADGRQREEIARELGVTGRTITFHLGQVFRRWKLPNTVSAAVAEGFRRGILR